MEPVVYTPVSAVANLRRSAIIAAVLGALAIVVSSVEGRPLIGILGTLGLALGAVNNRLLQRSVIAHALQGVSKARFRGGVLGRLGGITGLAVILAVLIRPDGLAVFFGLAVFHVLMLVGATVPLMRSMRPTS